MDRYYFTYWIAKYGKNEMKKLIDKVCQKLSVPQEIIERNMVDDYLFHYFFIVYYTVILNYLGITVDGICFLLDYSLTPGTCQIFPPSEILKVQKDLIPEIEKYIKEDLKIYRNLFKEE